MMTRKKKWKMRIHYYETNKKTITKAEIAAMPKVLFPGRIFVIYTESEAEKAVAYLKDQRIVGVDTETRPSFKRGTTHKVALLQISTQRYLFLVPSEPDRYA